MTLSGLLDVTRSDPALRRALDEGGAHDLVAPPALRPMLTAALAGTGRTVLAVTATGREAEDLTAALTSLLDPATVAHFPAWETLPHERLSPRPDTAGQRLAVLRRLSHPDPGAPSSGPLQVAVPPVRAVLQPIVPGLRDLEPAPARRCGTGRNGSGTATRWRAWRRSPRSGPTTWNCSSTCCPPARRSSSATRSGSGPAPRNSAVPARSSWRRRG